MPFVNNRGVHIRYEVEGQGPSLVLHHGFSENLTAWYWKGFVEALKDAYQLILFDVRGHGASDKPRDPDAYVLADYASDVIALQEVSRLSVNVFRGLFSDNLDQNPFAAPPVEFPVKYPLPSAEVESAFGDGHDHFTAHNLAFHVRICIVLAHVVTVVRNRFVRGQPFEPNVVVMVQSRLVVIDEDGGGDVHGIDQAEAFFYAALPQTLVDLRRNVDKGPSGGDFEP
jgi:hypothetical protein